MSRARPQPATRLQSVVMRIPEVLVVAPMDFRAHLDPSLTLCCRLGSLDARTGQAPNPTG